MSFWLGASLALFYAAPAAQAATIADITAAAAKEGKVVWYDSLPREQGEAILGEFQKAYPMVKTIEYLEVPGAQKNAKITQESMAGGPTADVVIDDPSSIMGMQRQGFVLPVDWQALGVASQLNTPNEFMVAVTASTYGEFYNTDKIAAGDVPKTYDALVDPKWKGRIATWARAAGLATLAAAWGDEKTTAFVEKLVALQPRRFTSTYALAEAIGAGEVDLSFSIYHTAQPTIKKGAPVKWLFLDPIPVGPLYGYLLSNGRYPNAGKLLLKWLGSTDGALVYERVALRGNPFLPETATAKMLANKPLAMFDNDTAVNKADYIIGLEEKYGRMLQGR
jgi:iron(III) transport system substrate-binding protein